MLLMSLKEEWRWQYDYVSYGYCACGFSRRGYFVDYLFAIKREAPEFPTGAFFFYSSLVVSLL